MFSLRSDRVSNNHRNTLDDPADENGWNTKRQTEHVNAHQRLDEMIQMREQDDPNSGWHQRIIFDAPNRQEPRNDKKGQ